MKLAVFGGSFDPVHAGHVGMVKYLLERGICHSVVLVPTNQSPFKTGHLATAPQRQAMLKVVFEGWDEVTVHTCELDRSGPSYTIDTLKTLAAENPGQEFQLVLGQDNLASFGNWEKVPDILARAELVVFPRTTTEGSTLNENDALAVLRTQGVAPESLIVCSDFHTPVSSREVRAKLQSGASVENLVPAVVMEYIRKHHLYSC